MDPGGNIGLLTSSLPSVPLSLPPSLPLSLPLSFPPSLLSSLPLFLLTTYCTAVGYLLSLQKVPASALLSGRNNLDPFPVLRRVCCARHGCLSYTCL